MGNSGCVKYRKWNHTLELFRTLHALTHAHTEQIDITMYDEVPAKKAEKKWLFFCSKLLIERFLTFTTYSMYNEYKSRTKLQKTFPSTVYTERLLTFLTYIRNNKHKSRTKLHKYFQQHCPESKVQSFIHKKLIP